jgi:polyisoprenoid-binding protein YceI
MKTVSKFLCVLAVLPLSAGSGLTAETRTTYAVDASKSKIEIHVAKDGFLKAFGHDHLVAATQFSGEVRLNAGKMADSSVSFAADANSLRVIDPGESEKDRKDVQATMLGEEVLNVVRYARIEFSSTAVTVSSSVNGKSELQVTGTLSLHGTQKPVTLPVHLQLASDGSLTCDTEVSLLQSDFGITPYKAAGGAVKVKDKLKLTFHIVAVKPSSSPN